MNNKLKICFVTTGLGIGGAEKQICDLADTMISSGHDVCIISITGETIVKPKCADINIIECNASKGVFSLLKCIFKISKIIDSFKPDIIHSHMYHANLIARFSCSIAGLSSKLICTAHNKNEGGKLRMLSYRLTDFLCAITTNVSQEAVDEFINEKAFKSEKSRCVYDGLNINNYYACETKRNSLRHDFGCNKDTVLLISIGRLVEAKDHLNLLMAMSQIEVNKKLKLVIIGDGPLRNDLISKALELDVADNVIFTGFRNDITDLLNCADIFVLPSRWEGFGLVVAEAMLCEKVVVATDSGGVKEVVSDSFQLVPINNSNALAIKIAEIIALDSAEKTRIGLKNRKHVVDNFSLDNITSIWIDLYKTIC